MVVEQLASITEVAADAWDDLFRAVDPAANPFLRHAFLAALEDSGAVSPATGWTPCHLLLHDRGRAVAAMPLYLKDHSSGEFVFDWGWARAYEQHGLDYYPKALTAAPFTPSRGPRMGVAAEADRERCGRELVDAAVEFASKAGLSSWHLLFPDDVSAGILERQAQRHGLLWRKDVQFHWRHRGYRDFDDFLTGLKSSRRKNVRRERRRVAEAGVRLERIDGPDIPANDWEAFRACYHATYTKRSGHPGYLDGGFFDRLLATMPENLLLIAARRDDQLIASALCLHDRETLYGRYWGCLEEVDCLHFETCFYQGIEYCIERGLTRFDPGAQGEHKLMRGFEPTVTRSCHWIADPRFRAAIAEFLDRERPAAERYGEEAAKILPFRAGDDSD